jgi:hypothetical protein
MEILDTGKMILSIEENRYISAVIYTNDELSLDDVHPIEHFLNQFNEPVPALIVRKGRYAVSMLLQIAIMQWIQKRLKAIAYLERDHRDVILTRIAADSYFGQVEVKSFYDRQKAVAWLKKNYATTPLSDLSHT